MQMSARNQLAGRIKKVKVGSVMTEVVIQVGDQELVAAITSGSAKRMKLRAGDQVFAIIKATEVMVAKEKHEGEWWSEHEPKVPAERAKSQRQFCWPNETSARGE
jgi:molybdopterin-binding protein